MKRLNMASIRPQVTFNFLDGDKNIDIDLFVEDETVEARLVPLDGLLLKVYMILLAFLTLVSYES